MNHVYRVIFNRVLGCWQAVTELAKSSGKLGGSIKRHAAKLAALAAMAAGAGGVAGQASAQNEPAPNQLPQGGNVTAGSAQINQSGNVMNIDQSTQKAIINWQEFNVGKDATVNFNQPGASSATLNRVLDSNPSQIFGRIVAPGQVILINPNGAYFAPSASVDVGGLIATTHELADKDFLEGNYQFKRNGASGKIINDGELKAKLDGYIALMAPEVRNQGVIVAERGTVALASGEHIQLDFGTGNKLQGITVTEQDFDAQIENKHAIIAEGGLVILSARATAELRASVIKNSGQIVASAGANTVTQKGGRIILEGNDIEVTEGSELIATGPKGGGEVLVGGDWQGGANEERRVFQDPNKIHQATKVTIETNTKIDASATDNGDGGTVVVWSDVTNPDAVTTVQGEILAMGGENGGDGGQIETSGARLVIDGVTGSTAARNEEGQTGEWLFDPYDITISSSTDNNTTSTGAPVSGFDANDTSSILNVQTLVDALENSNVTVTTGNSGGEDGNITVAAAISSNSGNNLTLEASNAILIEAGITLSGSDLTLDAGGDIDIYAPIDLSSGKLSLEYGQADAVLGNTASYRINAPVSLGGSSSLSIKQGSNGSAVDYQVISTAAQLQAIKDSLSGNFALGASINVSAVSNWIPIGGRFNTNPYAGHFEGLGNAIVGLTINRSDNSQGLFADITGTVSNLQLLDVNIAGEGFSGSLAGSVRLNAAVRNVYVTGRVSGGTNIGGLAGEVRDFSRLINVAVDVDVSARRYVGGVVGRAIGTSALSNVYSSGSVLASASEAGGLVGITTQSPSISNSYSSATVSASSFGAGVIGSRFGGTVADTYFDADAAGLTNAVGYGSSAGITTLRSSTEPVNAYSQAIYGTKTGDSWDGFDFDDVWFMVDGHTRPFLRMERSTMIRTGNQLQLMMLFPDADYTLANDINLSAILSDPSSMWRGTSDGNGFKASFVPIGTLSNPFSGTLTGSGQQIQGLFVTASHDIVDGLFAGVSGSTVTGLKLVDANIQTSENSQTYTTGVTLVDDTVLNADSIQIDGTVEVGTDHNLNLTFTSASRINGQISGDGGVTISGSSAELQMNQVGTYAGGTSINSGTVVLDQSSDDPFTGGPLGTGSVTVSSGATLDLNGQTLGNALSLAGSGVANAGALTNSSGDLDNPAIASGAITLTDAVTIKTTGALTLSGAIDGSYALTLDASGLTIFGGAVGVGQRLGAVTINQSTGITISDTFSAASFNQTQAGTGIFRLDGALDTDAGAITINSATVDLNASITTTAGHDGSTDNGKVTITAGAGGMSLAADESITTIADSPSKASGAIAINSSGAVSLDGVLITTGAENAVGVGGQGGDVTITVTGAATIDLADITTSGGATLLPESFAGGTAGNITITSDTGSITLNASVINARRGDGIRSAKSDASQSGVVIFDGPVILADDDAVIDVIRIQVDDTQGSIHFKKTVNSEDDGVGGSARRNLTLTAGAGDVVLSGAVGGESDGRLGVLDIVSAKNVTATGIRAASVLQQAYNDRFALNGVTTFNGPVDTDAPEGVNITNGSIALNGSITTTNGGIVRLITNADRGRSVVNIASAGVIDAGGAVTIQGERGISTGANIVTFAGAISLVGPTTLSANVKFDTNNRQSGSVNFGGTLDSLADQNYDLELITGSGDITFQGAVGGTPGGTLALGAVKVTEFRSLTASQTFNAESLNLSARKGGNASFNGSLILAGGFISSIESLKILGTNNVIGESFSQKNPRLIKPTEIGGNITSTTSDITFGSAVTLTGNARLAAQNITFDGTVNGGHALTLAAQSVARFNAAVGDTTALTSLTTEASGHLQIDTTRVRTQNNQTYNAPIVFSQGSLAAPLTLTSLAGDIDLGGTVSAGTNAKGAQRSLSLQATNGNVHVRDQIGLNLDGITPAAYASQTDVNPYALTVNAQDIWLLADVTTFEEQTYTGSVHVGNNGSNGSTRLLVSLDPSIRINGSIDDTAVNGHTLDLRAVNLDPASMLMPEIYLGGPVGQQIPLLALNVFTGVQSPLPGAALSDVNLDPMARLGRVTIVDNVSTYGDQTYASGSIALGNTTQSTVVLYSETGAVNLLTHPGVSGGLINGNRLQLVLREGVSLSADTLATLAQAGLDISSVVRFVAAPAVPTPASGLFTGQVTYDSEFLARLQANRDRQLEFERVQAMSEQSGVLEVEVKVGELDGLECVAPPPDNTTVPEDC